MPGSTYSTNLKIELIPLGEQSGTWGNTNNTNLGTALEQAIVGYGNPPTPIFPTDANATLALTDSNASQTARNFALNVTSSVLLTATRELIVPTIQKPYLIFNNTSGSQSITVKTSAGTGVTVANGTYMLVYVDGTNVVPQISQLPVLYGGTGATTAANARTSLGVPALDGTGATGTWPISITGVTTNTASNGYGTRTVSTSAPTGGADGDIWYRVAS
jgi:hypothetical protein